MAIKTREKVLVVNQLDVLTKIRIMAGAVIEILGGLFGYEPWQGYYVNTYSGSDSAHTGKSWDQAFATIGKALSMCAGGERIHIASGAYSEAVVISVSVVLIGDGPRGSVAIVAPAAGTEAVKVTADDVTMINVGIEGGSTADYALNLHAVSRFRFYGGKLEGPAGTVVLLDGTDDDQCADILFEDFEICWGGSGILFDNSGYGYPTQIFLRNGHFHNLTDVHVGLAADGGVVNLDLGHCTHDNAEDGTPPTDYIKVDRVGDTGIVHDCAFATATNAATVLTIAAGIMWVANKTEAGVSTARPA